MGSGGAALGKEGQLCGAQLELDGTVASGQPEGRASVSQASDWCLPGDVFESPTLGRSQQHARYCVERRALHTRDSSPGCAECLAEPVQGAGPRGPGWGRWEPAQGRRSLRRGDGMSGVGVPG